MGVIRLKNMLFYGYHGVNESEKELGGKFEVDLELSTSLKKPVFPMTYMIQLTMRRYIKRLIIVWSQKDIFF